VLWCYKKELLLSSHRKKRLKQMKKMMQRGLLDPEKEDPFALFMASTAIRYCYYADTHKILGNTFGMCVLQVRTRSWGTPSGCACSRYAQDPGEHLRDVRAPGTLPEGLPRVHPGRERGTAAGTPGGERALRQLQSKAERGLASRTARVKRAFGIR